MQRLSICIKKMSNILYYLYHYDDADLAHTFNGAKSSTWQLVQPVTKFSMTYEDGYKALGIGPIS